MYDSAVFWFPAIVISWRTSFSSQASLELFFVIGSAYNHIHIDTSLEESYHLCKHGSLKLCYILKLCFKVKPPDQVPDVQCTSFEASIIFTSVLVKANQIE
jgi:hypothetical protein